MKKLLFLSFLLLSLNLHAQWGYQSNDFDGVSNINIFIDSTLPNNQWQIAEPDKFQLTSNRGKGILTESISNYPFGLYLYEAFDEEGNKLTGRFSVIK